MQDNYAVFLVLLLFRQLESGFVSLMGMLPSRPVTIIALVAGVIAMKSRLFAVHPLHEEGASPALVLVREEGKFPSLA